MREKVDLSDPRTLARIIHRLSATRLGQRLGLGELLLMRPGDAQLVVYFDSVLSRYLDSVAREEGVDADSVKEWWESIRRQIVQSSVVAMVSEFSESTRLIMAAYGSKSRKDRGNSEEEKTGDEEWVSGEDDWF